MSYRIEISSVAELEADNALLRRRNLTDDLEVFYL